MRKIALLAVAAYTLSSCAELQQVANQLPGVLEQGNVDIAGGLKEALNNGISKQVVKLTATDGFFKNEAVKILLPDELKKVDKGLRDISALSELSGHLPEVMPRLDLALTFAINDGEEDVYLPDDTHWGSSGNQIAAETLLTFLLNR